MNLDLMAWKWNEFGYNNPIRKSPSVFEGNFKDLRLDQSLEVMRS